MSEYKCGWHNNLNIKSLRENAENKIYTMEYFMSNFCILCKVLIFIEIFNLSLKDKEFSWSLN